MASLRSIGLSRHQPASVMELVCCGCKGMCQIRRCSRVRNNLSCNEACTCQDTRNNCLGKGVSEDDDNYNDDDTDDDANDDQNDS